MGGLRVTSSLVIPEAELKERFTPSGGPGGQHANKASTRVELTWNVATSAVLGPRQRARLLDKLENRIDEDGDLRVVADSERSQLRNRAEAERRLVELVARALKRERKRRPTRPTKASKEKRLQEKRRRGEIKKARRDPLL